MVLDVSVAAKWFFPDEQSTFANALLDQVLEEGAYAPALFRWEIENVLLGAERANRIEPDDVDAALDTLRELPISFASPGERFFSGSEMALARHYGLTSYDAAYLSLAANHSLALATLDDDLAYAARDLGIVVLRALP